MTYKEWEKVFEEGVRDAGDDCLNILGEHLTPEQRQVVREYIKDKLPGHMGEALFESINKAVRDEIVDVQD